MVRRVPQGQKRRPSENQECLGTHWRHGCFWLCYGQRRERERRSRYEWDVGRSADAGYVWIDGGNGCPYVVVSAHVAVVSTYVVVLAHGIAHADATTDDGSRTHGTDAVADDGPTTADVPTHATTADDGRSCTYGLANGNAITNDGDVAAAHVVIRSAWDGRCAHGLAATDDGSIVVDVISSVAVPATTIVSEPTEKMKRVF